MTRRCLIISQGPVPTPEQPKVEGGGLRCWGLAKGIHANNLDISVTVAYHESYRQPEFTSEYEDIAIITWNDDSITGVIQDFDTVLVSYCMGNLSVLVADTIRPDQQLVLDCYVPIYVEVSARSSDDLDREFSAFSVDVPRWKHVLARGDLFLCASEAQRRFYTGVLSAVGRINPVTYGTDLLRVVPYGIYRDKAVATEKPITKLIGKDAAKYKKILWFGGIYPWFDLKDLIDAVKTVNQTLPAKLVIVGAKNPFNNHPDFVKPYENLVAHINSNPELKDMVVLQDWVDFNKRADWYLESDLVVVVNKLGPENELAWRTRLVDFMWAELPIITNGGDPVGELLLSKDAAARFEGFTPIEMATDIANTLKDTQKFRGLRSNLKQLKQELYWDVVTEVLSRDILDHTQAPDLQGRGLLYKTEALTQGGGGSKAKKALRKASMIPAYARKYGLRSTYHTLRTTLHNQVKKTSLGQRTTPKIVMIAHQLDLSGAPYVFLDLTKELVTKVGAVKIEFHTFNPSHHDNIKVLNKLGIRPFIHLIKDPGITFCKGDSAVLNTVAHSQDLKNRIFNALDDGTLMNLSWFIHEDEPELLFDKKEATRIKSLLASGKLHMFIAAEKTLLNYREFFGNEHSIHLQPYKYVIPKRHHKIRQAADFEKLNFILPGTVSDGRKGQMPILYALGEFKQRYYDKNPDEYRDFQLLYVGVEQDFLSRQITIHADKLLGNRFTHYSRVSHEKSQELIMGANFTICYSLRECLPLFVFEGMAAGHPLLRNDSSGMKEQLFPDKNGFYLDSKDFEQVVETFEHVLNKSKVSASQLAKMSGFSNKIALKQESNSYEPMVTIILKGFK